MTRNHTSRRGPAAFTLIELLVVIAIIAILIGMLVAGVMRIFDKGGEVKARNDISQMASQMGAFVSDRKINVNLPSRLLLKEDGDYVNGVAAGDQQLAKDSYTFLRKIFPKCPLIGMDWNGNGVVDSSYVILDGSQCLVFFLGGINGTQGFSSTPSNPTDSRTDRISFMNFDPKRLVPDPTNGYPRYNDPWGTPYAYFSSYNTQNGYNKYATVYATSDCAIYPAALAGPFPYYSSISSTGVVNYVNPKSFQIISAGPDMVFGPGGLWGPNNPAAGKGADDMANFSQTKLGSP